MKVGDQVPVTIAGQTVAMAEVKELGEGTATLIVPARRVVMATRTELTVEAPTGGGVELLTDAVVRPETPEVPVEAPVNSDVAPSPVANSDAAVQSVEQAAPPTPVEAPAAVVPPAETPSE